MSQPARYSRDVDDPVKNPATNRLPEEVDEEALLAAFTASGYPLQTYVANALPDGFDVTEEWTYVDSDTEVQRSLDLYATKRLYDSLKVEGRELLPVVDLFIECKRSDLPYAFFVTERPPELERFPLIAGSRGSQDTYVQIKQDVVAPFPLTRVLGANRLPFAQPTMTSLSFSRIHRKGKELELSGSDPFNSIFLPITKAMRYHHTVSSPRYSSDYDYFRMVFGLCVIDAPMVAVEVSADGVSMTFAPWVRLVRHEPRRRADEQDALLLRRWAVDAVHKDFLVSYLTDHLLPFADELAGRVAKDEHRIRERQSFDMNDVQG
jgi:hypothetical protein